jgi:hypothetical protein
LDQQHVAVRKHGFGLAAEGSCDPLPIDDWARGSGPLTERQQCGNSRNGEESTHRSLDECKTRSLTIYWTPALPADISGRPDIGIVIRVRR